MSTHIKCDAGNGEDSLCDRIQLESVNVLLVSVGGNSHLQMQLRI